jgi:N-succinyldiaminopimelate aminotransferase
MPRITRKWSRFGTSIFTTMTAAANRANAINLAQGFPNFDGPDGIKDAATAAIRGHFNQYAPSAGILPLRTRLAERFKKNTGLTYDPESEVTVYAGATEALFCTFQALLSEGDEVITFAPFFDCYPAGAFSSGARLVEVPLKAPDWTFTHEDLEAAATPRTKMILINTPHNPTGRVFDDDELATLAEFARQHDLIVVTDEVYEELIFDDLKPTRFVALPGMRERTVVISSTAKTFSLTGWKIGFSYAPKEMTEELRGVHQFTVFCGATPLQAGICAALELGDDYFINLRKNYQQRRDLLCDGLNVLGFKFRRPQGSYFVVADYSHLSKTRDTDFALWLTEHKKVAVIPTSVFYQDPTTIQSQQHYVRFAFCKDLDTLEAALTRLKS